MSAPLVVNTTDGVCWTRREETRGGEALYAPEKCQACPELVMVTLTELAERGIAGSADALPVPVGPERPYDEATRELLRLRARVTELETGTERLKANLLGWSKRGRAAEDDLKSARIRVAELEARAAAGPDSVWWLAQYDGVEPELFATEAAAREFCDDHAVGEVPQWDWFADGEGVWQQVQTSDLDDRPMTAAPGSVRRMTPPRGGSAEPGMYPPALPWARLMDHEDLTEFLDELAASAITHASSETALAEVEATCGRWRLIAEAQHAHNTAPGPMGQVADA